jgi:2-polyprenyl-3-methyl-5-hydroxy-6-metoxy-1,4-benzoquinol methylase
MDAAPPFGRATIRKIATMETVNCPLCGGADWTTLVTADDFDAPSPRPTFTVVRCGDCGLCFTNPRPDAAEIGRFYAADYLPHQISRQPITAFDHFKINLRELLPIFPRDYERGDFRPLGERRLLDFGCGAGAFLLRMKDRGWTATGLDFSEATVERLRTDLGLNALVGTLPHAALAPNSFDLVTLWHSLEHVHQPLDTLREVHRLLSPGGQVLVAVPNIDSISFAWFHADWFGLDVPRHLTHYSPVTLKTMLEKAGFRVLVRQNTRHSLWFRNSVERARRNGRLRSPATWMQSKFASSAVTRFQQWRGRADSFLLIGEKPY